MSVHLILLDLIILTICGEAYKLWSILIKKVKVKSGGCLTVEWLSPLRTQEVPCSIPEAEARSSVWGLSSSGVMTG
jgi:hypothetical protein